MQKSETILPYYRYVINGSVEQSVGGLRAFYIKYNPHHFK